MALMSLRSRSHVKASMVLYIYKTSCVAQLAKASYTQAVGHGFEPRLDDFIKWVLKYYLEVILYNCV